MSRLSFTPDTHVQKFSEQLGMAVSLMGHCRNYLMYQVLCLRLWTEPAIRHKQIKFFFDERGRLIGYITWAYLASDVEHRLIHDPNVLLHESEWNEGGSLWILDFVAPFGHAWAIVRHAMTRMFPDHMEARSLRRNPDGSVRKISIWQKRVADSRSLMAP